MAKLKEILSEHFERYARANGSTRVIVFGNLRATVCSNLTRPNISYCYKMAMLPLSQYYHPESIFLSVPICVLLCSRNSVGNNNSLSTLTPRPLTITPQKKQIHEIVVELADSEHIRPHEFVGQASKGATEDGGDAVPGLNQQQQQEVLQKFNNGEFNVLVATSIAEEGLDIAEVDMIVFFDIVFSPIRLVQVRKSWSLEGCISMQY